MVKIIATDIINDQCVFHCPQNSNNYLLRIVFVNSPIRLEKGVSIELHENLLDTTSQKYSDEYMFGNLDNPSGLDKTMLSEDDLINVYSKNKKIQLKRLWG